ncbi:MAG: methyl-accepting chemotaxis protein [Pseudomonadota bacterium]
MSFKTLLTLLMLGLCGAVIALAGLQFNAALSHRALAQKAREAVPQLLDLKTINSALTAERLRLYATVVSSRQVSAPQRADIVAGFAATDAIITSGIRKQSDSLLQHVEDALASYRGARLDALEAAENSAMIRDMSVADTWLGASRGFEDIFRTEAASMGQDNPTLARLTEETVRLKTALAEDAVALAALLATRKSFETRRVAVLAGHGATYRQAMDQITQLTAEDLPRLSGPAATLVATISGTYESQRAAIVDAGINGEPFPGFARPETWFEITTEALDGIETFRDRTFDVVVELEEAGMAQARKRLFASGAVIILSLLGSVAAFFVVQFKVVRPIHKTVGVLEQLASGNVTFSLDGFARRHEIGALTKGIESLRDAERQARANRAARLATNERLIAQVDEVVSAAALGDFTHTIQPPDDTVDAGTKALVEGVTRLCGIVSGFARDVERSVAALKDGILTYRTEQSYEGLFGDVTTGVSSSMVRVGDIVSDVQTSARQIDRAVEGISSGAADLSARTTQQTALVEESRTIMADLSVSVARNSDAAQEAAVAAQTVAQQTLASVETIDRTADTMARVETGSKDIADIVNLIDEIAFQTNILALNASVEAARAGSAGSGFAIVAQEVRALARRVSEAAMTIGEMITKSVDQVRDAAGSVRDTNASLRAISEEITNVVEAMSAIAALSQEQSAGVASVAAQFEDFKMTAETNQRMADTNQSTAVVLSKSTEHMLSKVAFFQTHGDAASNGSGAHEGERQACLGQGQRAEDAA